MAINVDLVADASKAIKEAGKLGDALDDVAEDLKDVGKTGATIDDKVQEAFRSIAKASKTTGKDLGDDVKKGTDKAKEGLSEMGEEAAGTAREAGASFSSIEDGADVLQEVLANAFAGFGPAGMAAGILAAAGVGLLFAEAQGAAEKLQENKEKMLELAQTIRDNGGVLTEANYIEQMDAYGYAIQDTKEWWEIFQEDAVTGWRQLKDMQDATGLSAKEMFRAGFGDADDAQATLDGITKRIQLLKDKKEAVYNQTGAMLDPVEAETLASLEKARDLVDKNVTAQREAEEIERQRKASIAGTTEALREDAVAKEAAEENEKDLAKYVAGTTENFRAQADAVEEVTDALKSSVTTELDYLDKQEALKTKLSESGNAWDINTAKGRENQRAVVDIASGIEDMAQASLDAGTPVADVTAKFQAQRDALVNQVLPAFQGNRDAAQEYIDKILQVPKNTTTTVTLSGEQTVREGLNRLAQPVGVLLKPEAPTETYFQSVLSQLRGREVPVMLRPVTSKDPITP